MWRNNIVSYWLAKLYRWCIQFKKSLRPISFARITCHSPTVPQSTKSLRGSVKRYLFLSYRRYLTINTTRLSGNDRFTKNHLWDDAIRPQSGCWWWIGIHRQKVHHPQLKRKAIAANQITWTLILPSRPLITKIPIVSERFARCPWSRRNVGFDWKVHKSTDLDSPRA